MSARVWISWGILLATVLSCASAQAFYILSPVSEACHERLMLGAVGAIEQGPFASEDVGANAVVEDFVDRVRRDGVPDDERTRAFIDEAAETYGFAGRSLEMRFVLASFVAGVRQPDTEGRSVVDFNETRHVHLRDDYQARHSLRRTGHDHETGNRQAVIEARALVVDHLAAAHRSWSAGDGALLEARWPFAFYGEADVAVFGPAYRFAQGSHAVQDAFAHTLRDDELRIVAVANFADAVQGRFDEARDGPAHSDRMDECDVEESAFDQMRIAEARRLNAALLADMGDAFRGMAEFSEKMVAQTLDEIYAFREGCTYANDYCDSAWTPISRSDETAGFDVSLCSSAPARRGRLAPIGGGVILLIVVWGVRAAIRSRSRRATA